MTQPGGCKAAAFHSRRRPSDRISDMWERAIKRPAGASRNRFAPF